MGRCERCDFWNPATSGLRKGVVGECRREAPRIDFTKRDGRGVFPTTSKDDWCGRYDDGLNALRV
jgi:hypothetical protein